MGRQVLGVKSLSTKIFEAFIRNTVLPHYDMFIQNTVLPHYNAIFGVHRLRQCYNVICYNKFCLGLRPRSTAEVMSGRSVILSTLFLGKPPQDR